MSKLQLHVNRVRVEKGVSIRELAKRSGVSKSHVQRIDSGEGNPSLEVMHSIAKALGVAINDLYS